MLKNSYLNEQYNQIIAKHPNEKEFHQAVLEMLETVDQIIDNHPEYIKHNVVGRLLEPERVITFRVAWMNQKGEVEVNVGYRVQYNSALGIYKGGIRFTPSVNVSILKFLAFEQTFKNALTPLYMGGGKGGADFDPINRSDEDIMRFTQAYMSELFRYIGDELDVPAGDIGVGKREIGYMYGFYKKLRNIFHSSFTGKDVVYGGSIGRPEATGFGLVYFTEEALKTILKTSYKDKKVVVSGSGQVGSFAAKKAYDSGAKVVAMSDISGYVYNPDGLDVNKIVELKLEKRLNLDSYAQYDKNAKFDKNFQDLWKVKCDIALPCATQNELNEKDIQTLIDNGVILVGEGANMPTTKEGIDLLRKNNIVFTPGKASNAGGVFVSGLEIAQNHQFQSFTLETIDKYLKDAMKQIFTDAYLVSKQYGRDGDLLFGANVHSFKKVADALIKQGVI